MKNKLNFLSAINKMSYGYTSFNILKELRKSLDIAFFPISNNIEIDDNSNAPWINEILHNGMSTGGYKDAPAIRLWHQFDLHMFPFCSRKIGFPIFELDDFTEQERAHIEGCDDIIVCSKWAKNIVEEKTKQKNVHVVPLGVDTSIFYPDLEIRKKRDLNKCIFLSIGKWELRKLADVLPTLFDRAFKENKDVELWISANNPFLSKEEENKWISYYTNILGDKVKFIPKINSQKDIANLINACDFLIQISRGEGWSLPSSEGLACGKFILACNYGGQTEFLNNDNSYLIDIKDMEEAYDGRFFTKNIGKWAAFEQTQEEQGIFYLKELYKLKQENKHFNTKGIETANSFKWENSSKKINDILYK